jgi:hypothetical protein
MKYLLKTVDGGDALNAQAGLFADSGVSAKELTELQDKRAKHLATAKRVDAYRSLWGINAGQLFGVAKCLTAWDELRRLAAAPTHPQLKALWALARGTDKEGRIGAGEDIRGDAKGFIEALGGLAACGKTAKTEARVSVGRLTETALNGYGEEIERTKGVTLVERTRERVSTGTRVNASTGEMKPKMAWRSVKTVLASIKTRLGEWTLVRKQKMTEAEIAAGMVDMRVKTAIHLAEQRYLVDANEGSPAQLGVLAVRAFWSALWDSVAALPVEPPPVPLWHLAVA